MITDTYATFSQYKHLINIDTSYRCLLKCPSCTRQKKWGIEQIKRAKDMPKEDLIKILDFFTGVNLCGQISDPIYHPDFLDLLKIIEEKNKIVTVSTNGSGKTPQWWEKAYSYCKGNIRWVFGVDGIDNKSELYRVGSNFKNVWEAMRLGKKLGHPIVWQYIVFEYNEKDIPKAIEISKKEGFTLDIVHTNRVHNQKTNRFNYGVSQASEKFTRKKVKSRKRYNETNELKAWYDKW